MECSIIACSSCQRHWPLPGTLTIYETRALASHPCPYCGSPRLTCHPRDEQRAGRAACELALVAPAER